MKIGRRRILLVAFALVSVVGLGGFYLRPHPGMCVKRDMMFWRTNVRAIPVRDNVYMLNVYGTDLISGNTAALVGDEGVLLVDAGHPEMLSKLLGQSALALDTFIYGLLLVLFIIYMPKGVVGTLAERFRRKPRA